MRVMIFARVLLLVGTLAASGAALAHHGWTGYDEERELTLAGTILESRYENPHGRIQLRTAEKTWNVVLAPTSRMHARGLPRELLTKGGRVTVVGYPHREKKDELRAERITIGMTTIELR